MLKQEDYFLILMIVVFASCSIGCSQSGEVESDTLSVQVDNYSLSKGNVTEIIDIPNGIDDLITVEVTNEVVDVIGSFNRFFIDSNENIIFIDKNLGNVTKINQKGEVVWQITSDPSDFRKYNEIAEAFYDKLRRQIVVKSYDKTYVYNDSGEFVSAKQKPAFNYNQLVVVAPGEVVYSCQGRPNSHLFDERRQLIWTVEDEVKSKFIASLPFAPENVVIGGFNEFSQLNEVLYYQAPFRDTFYRIELPSVHPDFTLTFDGAIKSDEVMQNKNVRNKLKYMREERIPQLLCFAADDHRLAVRYKVGYEDYFGLLDRKSDKWLINHRYLRHNGVTIEAPQMYHDGYFLLVFSDYQVKHFAKIDPEAEEVSKEWLQELEELDEAYTDVGPKTLYLIKL